MNSQAILEEIEQIASVTESLIAQLEQEAKDEAERQRVREEKIQKTPVISENHFVQNAKKQQQQVQVRKKKVVKVVPDNGFAQISNAMNELRDAIVEERVRVARESLELLEQNEEVSDHFAVKVCDFLNDFRGVLDAERAKAQEENLFPLMSELSSEEMEISEIARRKSKNVKKKKKKASKKLNKTKKNTTKKVKKKTNTRKQAKKIVKRKK